MHRDKLKNPDQARKLMAAYKWTPKTRPPAQLHFLIDCAEVQEKDKTMDNTLISAKNYGKT